MYEHINNSALERGVSGPVIYRANITVSLTADQKDYRLEENSPIERNFLVGLWVTEPGKQTGVNTTQADGDIFNSAALTIRVEEKDISKKIYFHQVKKCNDNGLPFLLYLPGRINLSESLLEVSKNDTISANTVLEFQAEYTKIKS